MGAGRLSRERATGDWRELPQATTWRLCRTGQDRRLHIYSGVSWSGPGKAGVPGSLRRHLPCFAPPKV